MKIEVTLYPGTQPPEHSNLVVGLYQTEGDAVGSWFEDGDWKDVDGDCLTPEFWFEVPSVERLKTKDREEDFDPERYADEGASGL